jgi:hypothetical protein
MQKLSKIYRKDYRGEDVVVNRVYTDSQWNPTTEFVEKNFNVNPVNDFALVIGNGTSRLDFNIDQFLEHRVGNFNNWVPPSSGYKKFYTYGCNALFRDYKTDFLVLTGEAIIEEVATMGTRENVVSYVNNSHLFTYPRKFSLIPQNPNYNSGTLAAYMAAFDGHKKVFLLGFDGNDTPGHNYNVYAGTSNYPTVNTTINEDFWVKSLSAVMAAYNDTEFVRVCPTPRFRIPDVWKYSLNFRQIDFRQFASEAGL